MKLVSLGAALLFACNSGSTKTEKTEKTDETETDKTTGPVKDSSALPGAFIDRWTARQARLQEQVARLAADARDFGVDIPGKRLQWMKKGSRDPLVVADIMTIGTWAHSDRSLLFAWANPSLPGDATIDRISGYPDRLEDLDEADAYWVAIQAAERSGAEYVYRAPGRQTNLYVAVSRVRKASESDKPIVIDAPWEYMRTVIAGLQGELGDTARFATLARNHARQIRDNTDSLATTFKQQRLEFAEELERIAGMKPTEARAALEDLEAKRRRWARR